MDEIKSIRDKAEAAKAYAKQAGEGLEMQNNIAEIKIRAGELLSDMDKNKGGWKTENMPSHDETPRLSDIGITRSQSSRWQSMAALPREEFDTHIEERPTAFGQSNLLVRVHAH